MEGGCDRVMGRRWRGAVKNTRFEHKRQIMGILECSGVRSPPPLTASWFLFFVSVCLLFSLM